MDTTTQRPPPLSRRMLAPKEFPDDPLDQRAFLGRTLALLMFFGGVIEFTVVCALADDDPQAFQHVVHIMVRAIAKMVIF